MAAGAPRSLPCLVGASLSGVWCLRLVPLPQASDSLLASHDSPNYAVPDDFFSPGRPSSPGITIFSSPIRCRLDRLFRTDHPFATILITSAEAIQSPSSISLTPAKRLSAPATHFSNLCAAHGIQNDRFDGDSIGRQHRLETASSSLCSLGPVLTSFERAIPDLRTTAAHRPPTTANCLELFASRTAYSTLHGLHQSPRPVPIL